MRLKVDENLPREACDRTNRAGHDAISVGQQGLGGADDARVYRLCQGLPLPIESSRPLARSPPAADPISFPP